MENPVIIAAQDASWVQVPSDSTGKRIKHVLVDEVQSDGSIVTVHYPAFVVVDTDNNVAEIRDGALSIDNRELLDNIQELTRGIAHLMMLLNVIGRPRSFTPAASKWIDTVLSP